MTEEVNSTYLASLIEMGIDEEVARKALNKVKNRSVEDALVLIQDTTSSSSDDDDEDIIPYKMLFVVNGSLKMSSGKLAAQVAHCAIDLYRKLLEQQSKSLNNWQEYGETKIVVRGNSTEELINIETCAKSTNSSIITSRIEDAGRTEIVSGSITCIGLFGTNEQLNPITGHLKLMQDCLKCNGK